MTSPATHSTDNQGKPEGRPTGLYRKYASFLWVGAIVAVALAAVGVFAFLRFAISEPFKGPTYVVKREPMRITIVERGSLESAENSDIVVRVKAGTKGSTNASIIKWVVDDGTLVKTGDKIVELDDSGFQDQLKSKRNDVSKAYSDWVGANNDLIFQESQNVSDIKTAEVNLIQFQLELKKYAGEAAGSKMMKLETQDQVRKYLKTEFEEEVRKESTMSDGKFTSAYLQDVSGYEGAIEQARSDKDSWMDRAAWSQRMVKKGFYSLSQADADQSRLASMEITLRKSQGDLDIYRIFEREKNVTKKWSDVKEAERALKRVQIQADSTMKKKAADETAKKSIYDQELDRQADMERDEKFYKMYSPQDGMIVYYIAEQARGGSGTQLATVAQGEPVREGQKLIRIPNLNKMLVNARVHEAMRSKVEGEKLRSSGFAEGSRLSAVFGRTDLLGMAGFQFGYDEARERFQAIRDKEQTIVRAGEPALIRVEANPGKTYHGQVKTVATVPSQTDWLSSDVKLYQTMVSVDDIDPTLDKLKPGMSAEVTIKADEIKTPVIVIPIQSVVGNVAMGADRKCYVLDPAGIPHPRDIKLGKSNDMMVEVQSGLEEGETVVLNPRGLIPESSGMKAGIPGTRKGAEFEEGGKKGKKGDGPPQGKGGGPK